MSDERKTLSESATQDKKETALVEVIAPNIAQAASAIKRFEQFKTDVLSPTDIVKIKDKQFLKKSAWRKLALALGLSDELVSVERTPPSGKDSEGSYSYRVMVRVFHAPTGRSSIGIAVAAFDEKKTWAHAEHDLLALAHTRAKNRGISDLVGGGEVSAEEMIPETEESDEQSASQSEVAPTANTVADTRKWHVLSDDPRQEPVFYRSSSVGTVSIDNEHSELALRPEMKIAADSGPVKNFLQGKFLSGIKIKHPEVDYEVRAHNTGLLDVVLVRMPLELERIKELMDACGWAFSKAAETSATKGRTNP